MSPAIALFGAGFAAGAMNSLAGGGSFVSLPALLAAGLTSVQANASSTVALLPGGLAGAWVYRKRLGPVGAASFQSLLLVTLVGGMTGAILLLWTPTATFNAVLPWLLLAATLALSFGRQLGTWLRGRCHVRPAAVQTIQFGLGVYGGYFGGAVGIMMMALWGLLDGTRDLKSLNAPRTLLVSAANAIAVLTFIFGHAVQWHETSSMLIGATMGGYCGALLGRRAPPRAIRAGTLLLTAGITLVFFVRACVSEPHG